MHHKHTFISPMWMAPCVHLSSQLLHFYPPLLPPNPHHSAQHSAVCVCVCACVRACVCVFIIRICVAERCEILLNTLYLCGMNYKCLWVNTVCACKIEMVHNMCIYLYLCQFFLFYIFIYILLSYTCGQFDLLQSSAYNWNPMKFAIFLNIYIFVFYIIHIFIYIYFFLSN